MSLHYDFHRAKRIIQSMSAGESSHLKAVCDRIRHAEERLNAAAASAIEHCMLNCGGMCCRNIHLDQLIGVKDFVFLLTVERHLKETMHACLEKESIYSADCLFLENGVGPCLFSSNAKPEMCICTFCSDATAMKQEIEDVKAAFNVLARFLLLIKSRAWLQRLRAVFLSPAQPG